MVMVFMLIVGIAVGFAFAFRIGVMLKNRARQAMLRAKQEVSEE